VVVALAGLMLLAACTDPVATAPSGSRPAPIGFGPGVSGGSSVNAAEALIGSWQRFDVFTADSSGDIVTQTTTWLFDPSGTCQRTITTFSAVEGIPRGTTRDCTWTLGLQSITLAFSDGSSNTFTLTFAAFDPDRLVLDGLEYRRLS
jgi:hypothetical protein